MHKNLRAANADLLFHEWNGFARRFVYSKLRVFSDRFSWCVVKDSNPDLPVEQESASFGHNGDFKGFRDMEGK